MLSKESIYCKFRNQNVTVSKLSIWLADLKDMFDVVELKYNCFRDATVASLESMFVEFSRASRSFCKLMVSDFKIIMAIYI